MHPFVPALIVISAGRPLVRSTHNRRDLAASEPEVVSFYTRGKIEIVIFHPYAYFILV